jgi:hypothetical protein
MDCLVIGLTAFVEIGQQESEVDLLILKYLFEGSSINLHPLNICINIYIFDIQGDSRVIMSPRELKMQPAI